MTLDYIKLEQKNLVLYGLMIFVAAFILRAIVAYVSYGGGDATNGASFVDFYISGYDIYSTISPWPYFPFANSFLWAWSEISDVFDIGINLSYRIFSSFFDACIATLIFYYLSFIDKRNSIKLSLVYVFNPITVIIVSTLGFTDSFALLFLILATITSELKKINYKNILIGFFLAVSISAKPIAIIFVPYFLYRSKQFTLLSLSLSVSLLLLNSYYLIGASVESIVEVLSLVLEKMTSGHQAGPLGIGSLTAVIGLGSVKIITVIGLLILAIVYILQINSKPADFILVIFCILLVFRYNLHPQYLAWIVPFAIMSNRNIFLYLVVGGMSLIVVISDWNDSSGALSLMSIFGFDSTNNESILISIYQHLSGQTFLGLALIASMLFVHDKKFYTGLIDSLQNVFILLPKITSKDFLKLVLFSLLIGYIYQEVVLVGESVKTGAYLRVLFLISMPTFIISYLIYKSNIKYKTFVVLIIILLFICVLIASYLLLLRGYEKPYNGTFIYAIVIVSIALYILYSSDWKLHKFVNLIDLKGDIINTKFLMIIFFIATLVVGILLVFPWNSLYKSASNQFEFDMDVKHSHVRKFYDDIKVNISNSNFEYGTNYIYQSSINFNKYFDIENIKSIEMELLSDSYYMLKINDIDVSSGYGAFYYMRHSTQRKYYDYGITSIKLDGFIKEGHNKLTIVDNISSPVSPAGISLNLVVKYISGKKLIIDLNNIEWDIHKGHVTKEGDITTLEKLDRKKLKRLDLNDSKYELDKDDLSDFIKSDAVLIAPKYIEGNSKSIMAPVDVYFAFYFLLISVVGFLLRSIGLTSNNMQENVNE